MWILESVGDEYDPQKHTQARCYACGYTMNADLFTRDNLEMIMEAHTKNCEGI
jgi:hypothetical protein